VIEFRHVSKRFGGCVAVDDVTLEIQRGEAFALLGPNGSGKSTTLRCLVGLAVPTQGQILVNGLDVREHPRKTRQWMSYLPQRINFPDTLTARELLEFYGRLRKVPSVRVEELLSATRFDFNGFANKSISEFSGGMIQRLALAVACLPDAPVLVFDEPTVSLDPNGAVQFRQFLAALKKEGKTIVFASHVLSDVEQLADRVAILVEGKMVALESIENLREQLIRHCRMRVTMSGPSSRQVELALQAGAQQAVIEGDSLLITSLPECRFEILKALESAFGEIASFATQDLSLEDVLLSYIRRDAAQTPVFGNDRDVQRKA